MGEPGLGKSDRFGARAGPKFPGPPAWPAAPCREVFSVTRFAWRQKRPAGGRRQGAGGKVQAAWGSREGAGQGNLTNSRAAAGRGAERARASAGWPATPCRAVFGVKRCSTRGQAKGGRPGVTGRSQGTPAGGSLLGGSRQILPNLELGRDRPPAHFLVSPSRVVWGVLGENGAHFHCGDRRASAFESRPANKSPDFGPPRKSAISGDVGEIRKSGFRDLVGNSRGGGILVPGGAFSDVSAARLIESSRRKLGPGID